MNNEVFEFDEEFDEDDGDNQNNVLFCDFCGEPLEYNEIIRSYICPECDAEWNE